MWDVDCGLWAVQRGCEANCAAILRMVVEIENVKRGKEGRGGVV